MVQTAHDPWERVVATDEGRSVTIERKLRLGARAVRTVTVEAVDGGHCTLRVEVEHVPGYARALFRRQAAAEEREVADQLQATAERSRNL
jgi:hypothetical protein